MRNSQLAGLIWGGWLNTVRSCSLACDEMDDSLANHTLLHMLVVGSTRTNSPESVCTGVPESVKPTFSTGSDIVFVDCVHIKTRVHAHMHGSGTVQLTVVGYST
jgi:hypothetical protein